VVIKGYPNRSAYLPFAALILLALVWGYNWVVMKVGMRYADPFTFAALRHTLGALALFAVVAIRRDSLRPKAFWLTALFGFFQTSLFALPTWAVHLGSAGRTSVLMYTMPFWLLAMSWPVLGERIRGTQWAAVVLALAGFIFILDPLGLRGLKASLLAVGGGIGWAIASLLFKIIRKRHEIELLSFSAWQGLLGSIPLIVVALIVDRTGPTWSASFISALVYNIIPATALAWLLWLYILHNLPAGTAGLSSLVIPVVGVLAAWIQLGEQPGTLEAVGMALIVAALSIITIRGVLKGREDPPAEIPQGEGPPAQRITPEAQPPSSTETSPEK